MDRLIKLLKCYSTWVVFLLVGAAAYWLQLGEEEQKQWLATYPWLRQVSPLAGLVLFIAARAKPQGIDVPIPQKETANAEDPAQKG
jgi:hypothetical protein